MQNFLIVLLEVLFLTDRLCFSQTPTNQTLDLVGSESAESVLLPVQYVPLAPCPCDLTIGACDFHCCCDSFCTQTTKIQYFHCLTPKDRFLSCNLATPVRREELSLFVCTIRSNTPFLGNFYENVKIAAKSVEYDDYVNQQTSSSINGYNRTVNALPEILLQLTHKWGTALGVEGERESGVLRLPALIFDQVCSWMNPVRFMIDQRATCVSQLSIGNCQTSDKFKVSKYMTPRKDPTVNENRQNPPVLLRGEFGIGVGSRVGVTYLCYKNRRPMSTTLGADVRNERIYLFADYGSQIKSANELEECTTANGSSVPADPILNNQVCTNVVTSVYYTFYWNSSFLINLTAVLILEDVQIQVGETVDLVQEFVANWSHAIELAATVDEDLIKVKSGYPRSGNPGYDFGRPLISAVFDKAGSPTTINDKTQIFLWEPGLTPLCAHAGLKRVNFGENTTSGCYLQLDKRVFADCQTLRENITRAMEQLFPVTHISKFGSVLANGSNSENFVPIFKKPRNLIESLLLEDEESRRPSGQQCRQVAFSLNLEVFFAETALINGISTFEVLGAIVYYNYTTWNFATQSATQRFYVSSKVRFFRKPPLRDPRIKKCQSYSDIASYPKWYRLGPLKNIRFDPKQRNQVPAESGLGVTYCNCKTTCTFRFYQTRGRFHCPSEVTCWDDLFFPFTSRNLGTDYSFAIAAGLISLIVLAIFYAITQPWAV